MLLLALLLLAQLTSSPAPSARITCAKANAEATASKLVQPQWPDIQRPPLQATVIVSVTVLPDGHAANVHIYKSSGVIGIDRAAFDAVRASTFHPKVVACKPTTGIYNMRFTYLAPHQ